MMILFLKRSFVDISITFLFIIVVCVFALCVKDAYIYEHLLRYCSILMADKLVMPLIYGLICSHFVGCFHTYKYAKSATTITERSLLLNKTREEILALLFVQHQFEIKYTGKDFTALTLRQGRDNHHLVIFNGNEDGTIRFITSLHIFELIKPSLKAIEQ